MEKKQFSSPIPLKDLSITDGFWEKEMRLAREEIIPYQWEVLNDRMEGAEPSYCMRNFRIAASLNEEKRIRGKSYKAPEYTFRGFQALPEDPADPKEEFYGFVFQDSDFYKWVEAVAYSLTQHPDPLLEETADAAIDLVVSAQQENGYLDTYYIINGQDKVFTNLRDNHELYCFGHLTEGAAAYYQATGKTALLEAAERYADYIASVFGPEPDKKKGYPGHEIAEMALVRLYEATGKEKYRDLAAYFVNERGKQPYYFDTEVHELDQGVPDGRKGPGLRYQYHQAHLPVREQKEAVGHAVRAVYLYSGMADIARLYEDEGLYEACGRLFDDIVNRKMYVTGGIGGTHIGESFSYAWDLPGDTAYAETCASIGLIFFARRMLQIHAEAKYGDAMETALYNTVLSGMALDGKSFFYVNPLDVDPEACRLDARKSHVKSVRQKWFGCACCPPNLARLLSSVGSYAYTENDDTFFLHLYIGGQITGKNLTLAVESSLPWEGRAAVRIEKACERPAAIALRIPGWCSEPAVTGDLSGAEQELRDGYLYLTKKWNAGDRIEIGLPMEVRFLEANPHVKEEAGKLCVTRGPLVYCAEEADNGKDLHLLFADRRLPVEISDREICSEAVKGITIGGFREKAWEGPLYRPAQKAEREPVRISLVPYYTWANRGENEMKVWLRSLEE